MNLKNKNILFLPNNMREKNMKNFMEEFCKINNERKKLFIIIDSNGGDPTLAFNLISLMNNSKSEIITISNGNCHSAASLIFLSGHKKIIIKNSQMVIHPPWRIFSNEPTSFPEIKETYNRFNKFINMATEIYKNNTTIPIAKLKRFLTQEGKTITFLEMKKYNMAKYYIDSLNEVEKCLI